MRTPRKGLVVAALLALPLAWEGAASAAVNGALLTTTAVTSARWAIVPTQTTSTSPPPGALSLTATSTAAQYFQVVNVGTVALTGATYAVTIVSASGFPNVTLTSCSVPWSGGTCGGTSTTIGTWSARSNPPAGQVTSATAVSTTAVPSAPGSMLYVEATPGAVPRTGVTLTVDTSVTSGPAGQVRSGATTDS